MKMPSSAKIEDRAIGALSNIIDDHATMSHQFNSMDKEMSWDGYIWIYKDVNGSQDKKNYDDKVSVQIKGHIDKEESYINKQRITYSVELEDLQIYFQDRGVLYFEVFMSEDGRKKEIFYTSLFPTKIKFYLEKAEKKGNKKTISIPFSRLEKKADKFYAIVKQFSNESKKQGFGNEQIVQNAIKVTDMDKVKGLTANVVGASSEFEFMNRLGAGEINFYCVVDGNSFKVPLEWQEKSVYFLYKEVNNSICIADKQYYDKYKIQVSSNDDTLFIISDNLYVNLKSSKFNFRAQTAIRELKKDAEFLLESMNHSEFKIAEISIPYSDPQMSNKLRKELEFYIDLEDTLSMIEFEYDKPFKNISYSTYQNFVEIVAMRKGLRNDRLTDDVHIYDWKVDNKYMPILIFKNNNGCENRLVNAVYTKQYQSFVTNDNGEHYAVPMFAYLAVHVISNLYEYKYDYFYEQIDKAKINIETSDVINNSVLNLIHAYDENKNRKLLEIALYALEKLKLVLGHDNNYLINELQIKKRLNNLEEADFLCLAAIKSNDLQLQCAKSILLENKEEARVYYEKMIEEIRTIFEGFPIYNLYKELFM